MSLFAENPEYFNTYILDWLENVAGYSETRLEEYQIDKNMSPWQIAMWLFPYTYIYLMEDSIACFHERYSSYQ